MRRTARPLLYFGVLVVVLGLSKVHALFIGHYDLTGQGRFGWTLAYAGILCTCAYGAGLPEVPRTKRAVLVASVMAAFGGALAISVVQLFAGDALLPRFVVFGSAIVLPDWYRLCVALSNGGRSRAAGRDRVLLIATSLEREALEAELGRDPERPASITGHLTPIEAEPCGDARPVVREGGDATVVVLDRVAYLNDSVVAQVAELHERGVRVRTLTAFYEEWLGKLPLTELERTSVLFDIGELHSARYGRMKRLVDICLAVLGLVPLVVVLPCVLMLNLVANRGPLFFRQERVGKGGAAFTILKFRTMRPTGPEGEASWTALEDPRITRVGAALRLTHLDELPQVLNILRGDLSVVGPRPEQPHYVEELSAKLPFYRLRHTVRPGLTGWAQVKFGYAGSEDDAIQKLQYEFFYLRHQNVSLDLRIVGRTVRSVLAARGR